MKIKINLIKSLHLIGIVLFVYILFQVDWKKFLSKFEEIPLLWFFITFLFLVFMESLRGIAITIFFLLSGKEKSIKDNILICFSSSFWANITPGRVGEFYRIRYFDMNNKKASFIIVLDRVFYGIFSIWMALFFYLRDTSFHYNYLIPISGLIVLFFLFRLFRFLIEKEHFSSFIPFKNTEFTGKRFSFLMVISFFNSLVFLYWNYLLLIKLVGVEMTFPRTVIMVALISLSNTIPITISGLGTREAITNYFIPGKNSETEAVLFGMLNMVQMIVMMSILSFVIWSFSDSYLRKK